MPLGRKVGLGPGDIVLDGNPAPFTERGTAAPTFRPMSIASKRLPISATAELLLGNRLRAAPSFATFGTVHNSVIADVTR